MKAYLITTLVLYATGFAAQLICLTGSAESRSKANPISILTVVILGSWAAYLLIGGAA